MTQERAQRGKEGNNEGLWFGRKKKQLDRVVCQVGSILQHLRTCREPHNYMLSLEGLTALLFLALPSIAMLVKDGSRDKTPETVHACAVQPVSGSGPTLLGRYLRPHPKFGHADAL